jgi:hypothetical protein
MMVLPGHEATKAALLFPLAMRYGLPDRPPMDDTE